MEETMNYRNIVLLAASVALLFCSGLAVAAAAKAEAPQPAASQVKAGSNAAVPAKAATKVKLVDINAATIAQLKTLPGIGDPEAAKIIAGRPYGSKAQLLSRNIVDAAVYGDISNLVVAKQPFKDAAKNAAQFVPKK
jgi:DNA uptake protein ComE-like DNA-binding protein